MPRTDNERCRCGAMLVEHTHVFSGEAMCPNGKGSFTTPPEPELSDDAIDARIEATVLNRRYHSKLCKGGISAVEAAEDLATEVACWVRDAARREVKP